MSDLRNVVSTPRAGTPEAVAPLAPVEKRPAADQVIVQLPTEPALCRRIMVALPLPVASKMLGEQLATYANSVHTAEKAGELLAEHIRFFPPDGQGAGIARALVKQQRDNLLAALVGRDLLALAAAKRGLESTLEKTEQPPSLVAAVAGLELEKDTQQAGLQRLRQEIRRYLSDESQKNFPPDLYKSLLAAQNGEGLEELVGAFLRSNRKPTTGILSGLAAALSSDTEALATCAKAYMTVPAAPPKEQRGQPVATTPQPPKLSIPPELENALVASTRGQLKRLTRVVELLPDLGARVDALADIFAGDIEALGFLDETLRIRIKFSRSVCIQLIRAMRDKPASVVEYFGALLQRNLPQVAQDVEVVDAAVDVLRGNRVALTQLCAVFRKASRALTPSVRIALAQVLQGDTPNLSKFVKDCTKYDRTDLGLTVETFADVMRRSKEDLLVITYILLDRSLPLPDRLIAALRDCLRGDAQTLRDLYLRGLANRVSLALDAELVEALRGDREGLRRLIAEYGAAGVGVPVALNEALQKSLRGNPESLLERLAAQRNDASAKTTMEDLALALRGDKQRLVTVALGLVRREQQVPASIIRALAKSLSGDSFGVQDFMEKVDEKSGSINRQEIVTTFVTQLRNDKEGLLGLYRASGNARDAAANPLAKILRTDKATLLELIDEDLADARAPSGAIIDAWLTSAPTDEEVGRVVAAYEEKKNLEIPCSLKA